VTQGFGGRRPPLPRVGWTGFEVKATTPAFRRVLKVWKVSKSLRFWHRTKLPRVLVKHSLTIDAKRPTERPRQNAGRLMVRGRFLEKGVLGGEQNETLRVSKMRQLNAFIY
jgi:hypothetical protein